MKTVVCYYSLGGNCRMMAEARAKALGAPAIEVREAKPRSLFSAYTAGCVAAMRGRKVPLGAVNPKISECDRLYLYVPIWAGMPAPALNSLADVLRGGQSVEVNLVSGSGGSKAEPSVRAMLEAKGITVLGINNIKQPAKPKAPKGK